MIWGEYLAAVEARGTKTMDLHGLQAIIDAENQPNEHQKRKNRPVATGVLDYFPDALLAIAEVSKLGNDQHNPGQPLHWAKEKSTDHADCIVRHLLDRGHLDSDGSRHSAKLAWRALALLQTEIENDRNKKPSV